MPTPLVVFVKMNSVALLPLLVLDKVLKVKSNIIVVLRNKIFPTWWKRIALGCVFEEKLGS